MSDICAFWDSVGEDGWARVTGMHHQPAKLDAEHRAQGVVIENFTEAPTPKYGWSVSLYVHPETGAWEWKHKVDRDFRMPAADFMAMLPASARVQARAMRDTDPAINDFLELIEMTVQDNASNGINPAGKPAREGLAYLVSLGMMTQEQADGITG